MAALLPIAAMAIPALLGAISGGINIATAVKGLRGGRLRRHLRGKGLSPMYIARPYAGAGLLAPAGRGLSPMYIARPYAGAGAAGFTFSRSHKRGQTGRGGAMRKGRGMLIAPGQQYGALVLPKARGDVYKRKPVLMIAPPADRSMSMRPRIPFADASDPIQIKGTGLLFPAGARGGAVHVRRGHYRTGPSGKRVHVSATVARSGGSLIHRKGYYRHDPSGKRVHVSATKVHRPGAGIVADILGAIPMLGSIAGPLARSLGGRVRRRGAKRGGYLPYTWNRNALGGRY